MHSINEENLKENLYFIRSIERKKENHIEHWTLFDDVRSDRMWVLFVPRNTYLTESIVSSCCRFSGLFTIITAGITPLHRRIQIEHFEWFDFFRIIGHFAYAHKYLSTTFVHRIDCFVHEYRHGTRWLGGLGLLVVRLLLLLMLMLVIIVMVRMWRRRHRCRRRLLLLLLRLLWMLLVLLLRLGLIKMPWHCCR